MNKRTILTALILSLSFVFIVMYLLKSEIVLDAEQRSTIDLLLKIYAGACIYCIVASEFTRNYSQVDRLWSLLPLVYCWLISYQDNFSIRTTLVAVLVSIWGLRLSYNFAKKGGYSWIPWRGEEDYRWAVLRGSKPFSNPVFWSAFNIFFICIYQLGLILYFCLPAVLCMNSSDVGFNIVDLMAVIIFLTFFMIELIADKQQFKFQTEKYQFISRGEELKGIYKKGFIDHGLWAYVRHPNYLGEQMMWFAVYLFSVAATGEWINWTVGGIILLVLLFKGSSDFSESISSSKYPEYKDYIKKVGRFIPKFKI